MKIQINLIGKLIKLENKINNYYYDVKYYNNSYLHDLKNKFDDDFFKHFDGLYYLNQKQSKKLYIKYSLQLNDIIENNLNILNFQNNFKRLINGYYTNI